MGWAGPSWNSGPGPAQCVSGREYEDVPSRSFQFPSARVGARGARVSSLPQSWAWPAGTTARGLDPKPVQPMTCSRSQNPPQIRGISRHPSCRTEASGAPGHPKPLVPPDLLSPAPGLPAPLPHSLSVCCFLICSFPLILRGPSVGCYPLLKGCGVWEMAHLPLAGWDPSSLLS